MAADRMKKKQKQGFPWILPAVFAVLCAVFCSLQYAAGSDNVIYTVETSAAVGPGEEKPIVAVIHTERGPQLMENETAEVLALGTAESAAEIAEESEISEVPAETPEIEEIISTQTEIITKNGYKNGDLIGLDPDWRYAEYSMIHTGTAVMYTASSQRKDRIVAVNAGHGTSGGSSVKTLCHPDGTPKLTGGSTAAGSTYATAVSTGMTFNDGTPEALVTLSMARILRDMLLSEGYDVLMLRDDEDVQLDNIARTVISNNTADIHIALHWDSDGLSTIKGAFYMSVPDGLKTMEPVASHWQEHEALGDALIAGLVSEDIRIWSSNPLDTDLTQTSYSTIPSVDIELGNQCSDHSDSVLTSEAHGLVRGINSFFGY